MKINSHLLCASTDLASLRAHLKENLGPSRAVTNSTARYSRTITLNTAEAFDTGRKQMKKYGEWNNCLQHF